MTEGAEFSTAATIGIELDDRQMSAARSDLEEALGGDPVQVEIEPVGGSGPPGSMMRMADDRGGRLSGRARTRARQQHRWARQRTNSLEKTTELLNDIEDKEFGGGGSPLSAILGGAATGVGGGGALAALGSGAATGVAGLGVGLGAGAAGAGIGWGLGQAFEGAAPFVDEFGGATSEVLSTTFSGTVDLTDTVGDTAETIFDDAVDGTVDMTEVVAPEVSEAFDTAVTGTVDITDIVATEAGDAFEATVTETADVAETVTTEAGDAFDSAITGTANIADSAADAFAGAVDGAIPDEISPSLSIGGTQTISAQAVDAGPVDSLSADSVSLDVGAGTIVFEGAADFGSLSADSVVNTAGAGTAGSRRPPNVGPDGEPANVGGMIVPGQQSTPEQSGGEWERIELPEDSGGGFLDDLGTGLRRFNEALSPTDATGGPPPHTQPIKTVQMLRDLLASESTGSSSSGPVGSGSSERPSRITPTETNIDARPTNIEKVVNEIEPSVSADIDVAIQATFEEFQKAIDDLEKEINRQMEQFKRELQREMDKEIQSLKDDITR